ncbi:unnamed protein product [Sympodiomycopsis kandeliae]
MIGGTWRALATLVLSVVMFSNMVIAQQYVGAAYNNSMPGVPGSEITFWNIPDAKGKATSMLNYHSTVNGKRQDPKGVKRVVIIIHGANGDPGTYMSNMLSALSVANRQNSAVNTASVAVVAPFFANGDQKGTGYPWTDGLSAGQGSTSSALVWKGSGWASGLYNQYPNKQQTVSSYYVLDQMVSYFSNKAIYPNVNQIVVAGHSLGGQTVNRYAIMGKNLGLSTPIRYWMGNPNDYGWMTTDRPTSKTPASVCPTYDDWRQGLATATPPYAADLVGAGRDAVLANYNSKSKIYAKGTLDQGDDSSSCAPYTVGATRDDRFYETIKRYPPTSNDNVDYSPIGHDGGAMMASPAGLARLFFDNFNGDGSRAADFGDRNQIGDSPQPNPQNAAPAAITGTGANGMTYQGCYTDVSDDLSGHSLPNTVQVSSSTVESCTAACSAAGYSITGLQGNTCFCGNALSYQSAKVVDKGCSFTCPGNSAELCGGTSRLSIYSSSTPASRPKSAVAQTAGTFKYQGCYVDSGPRTLSGSASAGDNMSADKCAANCAGYQYFGVEYARECYCGNTINNVAAGSEGECNYICMGDNTQICGGSSRINIYNNTVNPSTSTSTTAVATSTATATATAASTSTAAVPASTLSNDANYKNCYVDNTSGRILPVQAYSDGNNSAARCSKACSDQGYSISGTQYSSECWCGSQLGTGQSIAPSSDCNMACSGNSTQACGGPNRLSVYSTLADPLPVASAPIVLQSTGTYTVKGCYVDDVSSRLLSQSKQGGSAENCAKSCNGSKYFGLEYSSECYCDDDFKGTLVQADIKDCGMTCSGNAGQYCGGPNRVLVYENSAAATTATSASTATTSTTSTATDSTATTATTSTTATDSTATSSTTATTATDLTSTAAPTSTDTATSTSTSTATTSTATVSSTSTSTASTSTGTTSTATSTATTAATSTSTTSTSTSTTTSSTSTTSAAASLPTNYQSLGCYYDGSSGRTLNGASRSGSDNTPTSCAKFCSSKGYEFSGTEYSSECYCGSDLNTGSASSKDCSMPCSGDSSSQCGGPNRISLVKDLSWQQTFFTVKQSGQWTFTDCVVDTVSPRTLEVSLNTKGGNSKMTVDNCLSACQSSNLKYCGMEYSGECFGSNSTTATFTSGSVRQGSSSSDPVQKGCNMPCNGDSTIACGGPSRLNLYTFDSNASPDRARTTM